MGVITCSHTQYVFLDTPGWHIPKTRLGEYMQKAVRDSSESVDAVFFVTWPKEQLDDTEKELLIEMKKRKVPMVLVVNKSDTVSDRGKMKADMKHLKDEYGFDQAIPVSALNGDGMEDLTAVASEYAKDGEFMFEEDALTDQPERVVAAEFIREKLIKNLKDELPYGIAVSIERFKEREDRDILDIDATILCEKQSHKGIIIGKNGLMLKKAASEARIEIEELLDIKVNLKCWVKVREGWRDNDRLIKEFQSF